VAFALIDVSDCPAYKLYFGDRTGFLTPKHLSLYSDYFRYNETRINANNYNISLKSLKYLKVKQSHYRPVQAQRVTGG